MYVMYCILKFLPFTCSRDNRSQQLLDSCKFRILVFLFCKIVIQMTSCYMTWNVGDGNLKNRFQRVFFFLLFGSYFTGTGLRHRYFPSLPLINFFNDIY